MYSVAVTESSRPLSKKETVSLKTGSFVALDKLAPITITPTGYAVLDVNNDRSKGDTRYTKYIIFADEGVYSTGSEAFWETFRAIYEEMADENEKWQIAVEKVESKNYAGKYYLNCHII